MRWEIPAFFDPHVHLREGNMMVRAITQTSLFPDRVCAMLNLSEPIGDAQDIKEYHDQAKKLLSVLKRNMVVMPVPLLDDETTETQVSTWRAHGVRSVKYMPRGATTNSHHGITHPAVLQQNGIFDCLSDLEIILQVHAEAPPGPNGPTMAWALGAEREFIDTFCDIAIDHPKLKMIFEHVSTKMAIQAIRPFRNVAATITPHHLTMTVDNVLDPSRKWVVNPHNYCRPIAKREEDREALIEAACSDNERIFFGSDYAPHSAQSKSKTPSPAGCANYPAGPYVLTRLAIERDLGAKWLADFTSRRAMKFFDLVDNQREASRSTWRVGQ